jgi:hypothetical protein
MSTSMPRVTPGPMMIIGLSRFNCELHCPPRARVNEVPVKYVSTDI